MLSGVVQALQATIIDFLREAASRAQESSMNPLASLIALCDLLNDMCTALVAEALGPSLRFSSPSKKSAQTSRLNKHQRVSPHPPEENSRQVYGDEEVQVLAFRPAHDASPSTTTLATGQDLGVETALAAAHPFQGSGPSTSNARHSEQPPRVGPNHPGNQ